MTLLDATVTLIDTVKSNGLDSDREVARALKRMEKRLMVLRVREAWARKRNRLKAFWDAMALFDGGVSTTTNKSVIPCKACKFHITWGDFCKNADFTGHGKIRALGCPKCGCMMERPSLAITQ